MTMGEDDTYSIEELAAQAGMTARNVRAYRTRGLLPPPLRRGRVTRYDQRHLERLLDVQQLREAGVPLRMITEAAERGADLSQGGELWRLMVTESSPWSRRAAADDEDDTDAGSGSAATAGRTGVSVDLRSAGNGGGGLDDGPGWEPLHPALATHLSNDPPLKARLADLGVVTGSGRLLYGSTDVGMSLRAMTGEGIPSATALTVAAEAAEASRDLAAGVLDVVTGAGHDVSPAVRDVLVRLTLGVMRDTLAKELDVVR
jgi:DNA-binding transcriptional MerR regulator